MLYYVLMMPDALMLWLRSSRTCSVHVLLRCDADYEAAMLPVSVALRFTGCKRLRKLLMTAVGLQRISD